MKPQGPITYEDLRASVYLADVPAHAAAELPDLYESSFAVVEYFRIFDRATALSACILDDPRHVVFFSSSGPSATILNQLFDIDAAAANRVCRAIFRACSQVRRVRFNGCRLDPAPLSLPNRVLASSEDTIVELPGTYHDYLAGLGASTRKNLRWYTNRFAKNFPGHMVVVHQGTDIPAALAGAIITLNRRRMEAKGEASSITTAEEGRLLEFIAYHGFCTALVVDGCVVAGTLGSRVGREYYGHVQGFDPQYAKFRPGWLCLMHTLEESHARGVRRFHTLWGEAEYKTQLGGSPQVLRAISVYRSRIAEVTSVDDALRIARWHARHGKPAALASSVRARAGRLKRRLNAQDG